MQYGMAQFPVLGGLILGNIVLIKIIDKLPLGQSVMIGLPLMLLGTSLVVIGTMTESYFLTFLILGMSLVSFGEGISFSVLYRFALMSSEMSKGTVAAAVSVIMMLTFFAVIEIVRVLYENFGLWAYSLAGFTLIILWFSLPRLVVRDIMRQRKLTGEF